MTAADTVTREDRWDATTGEKCREQTLPDLRCRRWMKLALTLWGKSPGADNLIRRARWSRGLAGRVLDDPRFQTLLLAEPKADEKP